MNDIDDLISLVRDEIGLPVTAQDAQRGLDELPGWDSVHVLWLATALERTTGTAVALPDLLEATSLQHIYELVVSR